MNLFDAEPRVRVVLVIVRAILIIDLIKVVVMIPVVGGRRLDLVPRVGRRRGEFRPLSNGDDGFSVRDLGLTSSGLSEVGGGDSVQDVMVGGCEAVAFLALLDVVGRCHDDLDFV